VARQKGTAQDWLEAADQVDRRVSSIRPQDNPDRAEWSARIQADFDGWRVRAIFVEQAGSPVLRELHITPRPRRATPQDGVTSRWLRSLTLTPLLDSARALADRVTQAPEDQDLRRAFQTLLERDLHRRTGRPGRPAADYARMAIRYEQLLKAGSRKPVADLAGELHLSRPRTRDLIKRARELGFLTRAQRGRAGGRATALAWETLKRAEP